MPRRPGDKVIWSYVTADEKALIATMAKREGCPVAELFRRAINSLAMDVGDEAVFIEGRKLGRPRREEKSL